MPVTRKVRVCEGFLFTLYCLPVALPLAEAELTYCKEITPWKKREIAEWQERVERGRQQLNHIGGIVEQLEPVEQKLVDVIIRPADPETKIKAAGMTARTYYRKRDKIFDKVLSSIDQQ